MRQLGDLPINLTLLDTIKHGSGQRANMTSRMAAGWRRGIRSVGGFWIGTSPYIATVEEMIELFLYGLAFEIQETIGGLMTWQGFICQMDLTLGGIQYTRKWTDIANRVKAIYTKLGDNLFTNGSVETGPWSAYGSPSTCIQSTTWVSDGQ